MNTLQNDYNTQRSALNILEYGRLVQDYVSHINSIADKDQRTMWVHNLVNIMAILNPEIKLQSNYQEILWGHIHQISNFTLDVDSPYPLPQREDHNKKAEPIPYHTSTIRFRFYGRNLQNMIEKATQMEDGELKQELVNLIASFMYNSCKLWNNENLSNEVIAEHLNTLSKGKLALAGSEITVTADASVFAPRRHNNHQNKNNFRKNNNNKKNHLNNNNNRNKNKRRF